MIYGFKHRALTDLPKWAASLHFPYWMIQGRNKTKAQILLSRIRKRKIKTC